MEDDMKKMRSFMLGVSMLMLSVNPALAVDTSKTYNSGILVGLFLAFCALVIVVQLMPTIMLLIGFIRNLSKGITKQVHRRGSRG